MVQSNGDSHNSSNNASGVGQHVVTSGVDPQERVTILSGGNREGSRTLSANAGSRDASAHMGSSGNRDESRTRSEHAEGANSNGLIKLLPALADRHPSVDEEVGRRQPD